MTVLDYEGSRVGALGKKVKVLKQQLTDLTEAHAKALRRLDLETARAEAAERAQRSMATENERLRKAVAAAAARLKSMGVES